jgi:hypothetical protein
MMKQLAENKEPVTTEKDETTGKRMMCVQDFKDVADRKLPRVYRSKSALLERLVAIGTEVQVGTVH